uniref:Large ribosomal subunit protein uL23m n=1 Tax=Ornithorhynchus anatinus TaxID=9258 RepID=A0A6I8P2T1_ORNAN
MAQRVLYPLYQRGNPQLRVFRTNFFVQLVRPGQEQPEDTVQFRIPMTMTRIDLRNYLQSIYKVPVATVRTRIQFGSNKKKDHKNRRVKQPDYKVAYVQLAHGQTFTFPDLFPKKESSPEPGDRKRVLALPPVNALLVSRYSRTFLAFRHIPGLTVFQFRHSWVPDIPAHSWVHDIPELSWVRNIPAHFPGSRHLGAFLGS